MSKGYLLQNDDGSYNGVVHILSTTTGINGKTVTTTALYTVPTGRTAVITQAVARLTAIDTFALTGTAGIGVASGEIDIFPSTAMTGLSAVGKSFNFLNNLLTNVVATSGQVIKVGITVGFTATSATLAIDLIGYLL